VGVALLSNFKGLHLQHDKDRVPNGTWLRLTSEKFTGKRGPGGYFDAPVIVEAKRRVLTLADKEDWDIYQRSALFGPTWAELALSRVRNEVMYCKKGRRIRIAQHIAESFESKEGNVHGPWGRELRRHTAGRAAPR
jgi:hypothetical protein